MNTTTLNKILKHNPCEGSIEKFIAHHGETNYDAEITYIQILESNGLGDAIWSLRVGASKEDMRLFACDCAEHVLFIFEEQHPNDKRPREAIEVSRRYAIGDATEEELSSASAYACARASARARARARARASAYASASASASDSDSACDSACASASASASAYAEEVEYQTAQFIKYFGGRHEIA